MMVPWLDHILYANATLDLTHPDARVQLSEAVITGMPHEAMVSAARAVILLKARLAEGTTVTIDELAHAIVHSIAATLEHQP